MKNTLSCAMVGLSLVWCGMAGGVEWTFEESLEGWVNAGHSVTNYRHEDGKIQWEYTSETPCDPYFVKSDVSIDADTHVYIIVEADIQAQPGSDFQPSQFFFDNGSGFYGGDPPRQFAVAFDLPSNVGMVKTVTNAADANTDWHSTVTSVRIDPGNNSADLAGFPGAIDRIAVVTAATFARDPYVWDFESGHQGWNEPDPNGSNTAAVAAGELVVTYGDPAPEPFDPKVSHTLPLLFDADTLRYLRLDIRMVHSNSDPVGVKVYFTKSDGSAGSNLITITPNVATRTYILDMGQSIEVTGPDGTWSGIGDVTELRVDPGDVEGTFGPYDAAAFASSQTEVDLMALTDGAGDIDQDGLSDADEVFYGTDPANPDTDGDGVSDGTEVQWNSDPLNPDEYAIVPAADLLATALLVLVLGLFAILVLRMNPLDEKRTKE